MKIKADFCLKDYIVHGIYFALYGIVKYIPPPVGGFLRYYFTKPFVKKMGRVRFYEGVTVWYPYNITLGDNITLNEWVYISGYGELEIQDNVRIGHRTSILTSDHNFSRRETCIKDQGLKKGKVVVERDVFVGCNVTILKGVKIGQGAVISAGAVVTKNVAAYAIVAGVPARQIGIRGENSPAYSD